MALNPSPQDKRTTHKVCRDGKYWGAYPLGNRPSEAPTTPIKTFSERTKLVTSDAAGGGDGSEGSPWTLLEACTNAVAGDVVGIKAGVYIGTDPGQTGNAITYTPAFDVANSGTAENPIWFVAENPAHANASNRTEIYSGATVAESGWPAFGSYGSSYVKWVGIYTDENHASGKSAQDSGPVYCRQGEGCAVFQCEVFGLAHTVNNHSGIRCELMDNFEAADNKVHGFNGGTNESGILIYKSNNPNLHHNEIYDCSHSMQIKGATSEVQDIIYGLKIHHNLVYNCTHMWRFHGPVEGPSGELNLLYCNIGYSINYIAEFTSSSHYDEQNGLRIFNSVFHSIVGNDPAALWRAAKEVDGVYPRNNRFFNNILSGSGSYWGSYTTGGTSLEYFNEHMQCDRNVIHGMAQMFNGGSSDALDDKTLADWQALGQDVNSISTDPLFTDSANRDYTLQVASPASSLGRDELDQFGGGVNSTIPAGVYVIGVETIGVRV